MLPIIAGAVGTAKALYEFSKTPAGQVALGSIGVASAKLAERKADTLEGQEKARRSVTENSHKMAAGAGGAIAAAVARYLNRPRPPKSDWV